MTVPAADPSASSTTLLTKFFQGIAHLIAIALLLQQYLNLYRRYNILIQLVCGHLIISLCKYLRATILIAVSSDEYQLCRARVPAFILQKK
jgi:hypothetical protein